MATHAQTVNYVSDAVYKLLVSRYAAFQDSMGNPAQPVVRVYDPLSGQHLQELQLVRNVSMELQKKKHDDMEKAKAEKGKQISAECQTNETETIVEKKD